MVKIKIYKIRELAEGINNGFYVANIKFDFGIRYANKQISHENLALFISDIIKNLIEIEHNFKSSKSKMTFTKPGIDSIENYERLSGFSFIKEGLSEEEKILFTSTFMEAKNKLTAK